MKNAAHIKANILSDNRNLTPSSKQFLSTNGEACEISDIYLLPGWFPLVFELII